MMRRLVIWAGCLAVGAGGWPAPSAPPAPDPAAFLARVRAPAPALPAWPGCLLAPFACWQDPPGDPDAPPPAAPAPPPPSPQERYQYPFPTDVSEAAADLMKKADDIANSAMRKNEAIVDEFEKANALYREAAALAPKSAYPWLSIAQTSGITLAFADALAAIRKARALDPRSAILLVEEGGIHRQLGDPKKALESYDAALGADPKLAVALMGRAMVRMQAHDFTSAKTDLDAAFGSDPAAPSLQQLREMVVSELGSFGFTGPDVVVKETAHWRVLCTDAALAEFLASHAEAIYGYYTERFPKADLGKMKFPIYVFKDRASFLKSGAPPWSGGYYSPIVRKLVLPVDPRDTKWKPGKPCTESDLANTLLVLYHEGFHQFMHYSLERAPQWFNEGHGDFYGGARWDGTASQPATGKKGYFRIGLNPWRVPKLPQVLKSGARNPLPRLMTMTQQEMYGAKIELNYIQSWSVVYFLHTRQAWGERFLLPYYKLLRKGAGLREAYDKTFGRVSNFQAFEDEWKAFSSDLK